MSNTVNLRKKFHKVSRSYYQKNKKLKKNLKKEIIGRRYRKRYL